MLSNIDNNPFKLDFYELIEKADMIRHAKWGRKTFFVKNLHLNYTNICVSHCRFCAFSKDYGDEGAYDMSLDDAVKYVSKNIDGLKEVHIVGGLHPDHKFDHYVNMVGAIKTSFPQVTIKSFSAVEIDYFSKISSLPIAEVLRRLKKAGLEMLPGGGAEIFAEHVRNKICPEKISADEWLEIHRTAHKEGITTNATMLYGHLENDDDRLDHLLKLRALQEETKGFNALIPLAFHPENTFLADRRQATGFDDIRVIAASRIVLDNFPHIKAYWVMLGKKTAQLALRAGADDLDGTIIKENITYAAGARSDDNMTEKELINLISSAKLIPVERDSFYNEVTIWQI